MKEKIATLVAAVLISTTVWVGNATAGNNDIVLSPTLQQSEFVSLVDELGTAVAYNPLSPAELLGISGSVGQSR